MITRRQAIVSGAASFAGGAMLLRQSRAADSPPEGADAPTTSPAEPLPPGEAGRDYTPVITPNGVALAYKLIDGVKVFHLIAEEIEHEFAPGLKAKCWGYNGRTPGPTIEAVEGDRVRLYVTNTLPEPTTIHWHGLRVPNGMDGVSGLTQKPIPPGETFRYEFTLREHGTHMYHPHFDEMTQIALGMEGLFIIHPRTPRENRPDRDFAIMLSEWRIDPGTRRPNPMEMVEFNVFTMNSKAYPAAAPLVTKLGDRVRVRLANLGPMDHHPIHLHGYDFRLTETDGGTIPEAARVPQNTVLVPVGGTRAFEFVADAPGDWAMHCHMTHHTMNQMGHAGPNVVGMRTGSLDKQVQSLLPGYMTMGDGGMGDMAAMNMPMPNNSIPMSGGPGPDGGSIDMGGMFTVLKVRDNLRTYDDPGWYHHPPGTQAATATDDDLRRDGIALPTTMPAATKTTDATPSTTTTKRIYTCRMHPEILSDKAGKCPKCGMTLVLKM